MGSNPLGLYNTWVDSKHDAANDEQFCKELIDGITAEQTKKVYKKLGDRLSDKYFKEGARVYARQNFDKEKAQGTKKGTKRAALELEGAAPTQAQMDSFQHLYGLAPSEVTGQPYIDAPLNVTNIRKQVTVARKGLAKSRREMSQKKVMAETSAAEVTRSSDSAAWSLTELDRSGIWCTQRARKLG
jgi:hypothetical protein